MGRLADAVTTTLVAGTATVRASERRPGPDSAERGEQFAGVFDLVTGCGRGHSRRLGRVGRRLQPDHEKWWEPRGPASAFGGKWVTFADVLPLPEMPMHPQHPLFLLAAIPKWCSTDTAEPDAAGELRFTFDVGGAMMPGGEVVDSLRVIRARVRLDQDGRLVRLCHTRDDHAGGRFNPWRVTELSNFGCPGPVRPELLPEPLSEAAALERWNHQAGRFRRRRRTRGRPTSP